MRAAVTWNPNGARDLLAILREYPAWVKYKDDPFGPLHILLHPGSHRRQIIKEISVPVKPASFLDDKLVDCAAFGAEWRQRKFSKGELAKAIEAILIESDIW